MGKTFENEDIGGTVFRRVNLHQALFNDVNLGHAVFQDVNLEGASICNANLVNFSIEDANIHGMTIFGIRIDELIEAEFDRHDPERVRLRMKDIYEPQEVQRVLRQLEEVRADFRAALRSAGADLVCRRPDEGQWSALENVRHLLFAEQLYTDRWLLGNYEPWSQYGMLPEFLANNPAYAEVGRQPCDDLEAVLSAWEAVHARTLAFAETVTPEALRRDTSGTDFGQGTVGAILQGLAQHDLQHIRQATGALETAAKKD